MWSYVVCVELCIAGRMELVSVGELCTTIRPRTSVTWGNTQVFLGEMGNLVSGPEA